MIPPAPVHTMLVGSALYVELWCGLCRALAAPWLGLLPPAAERPPIPARSGPDPRPAAAPPPRRRPRLRVVASSSEPAA